MIQKTKDIFSHYYAAFLVMLNMMTIWFMRCVFIINGDSHHVMAWSVASGGVIQIVFQFIEARMGPRCTTAEISKV